MRHESTQTPLESIVEQENQSTYAHFDANSSTSRPTRTPIRGSESRTLLGQQETEDLDLARRVSEVDAVRGNPFGSHLQPRDRADRNRFYSEREGDDTSFRDAQLIQRTTSTRPLDLEEDRRNRRGVSERVSKFGTEELGEAQPKEEEAPTHPNRKRLRRVRKGRQTFLEMVTIRSGTSRRHKKDAIRILGSGTDTQQVLQGDSEEDSSGWTDGSEISHSEMDESSHHQEMDRLEEDCELGEKEFDARMNTRGRSIQDYHYRDSSEEEEI